MNYLPGIHIYLWEVVYNVSRDKHNGNAELCRNAQKVK